MDLVQETPDFEFVLRGADAHRALVNARTLTSSFILTPERLLEDWPVRHAAELDAQSLAPVIALEPEVLLLGCGERQVFPPAEVMAELLGRGIGLEPMGNAACARTFNVLAGECRRVAAAFILSG